MTRTILTAIATLGLLSACSDGAETPDGQPSEAANMTPEGPSMMSRLMGGGKPMPLDIQQAHANGVILQLDSIQAKPSETVIVATITNGDKNEQTLNRNNNKDTYIVTGNGSKLYLSAPVANPQLQIPAGQRMQAELVFLGRLTDTGSATLIVNDGDSTDNQYTRSPGFRVPLPLQAAAFSDDGSKKN